MNITLLKLKHFLQNIQNNHINQINISSTNFKMIINNNTTKSNLTKNTIVSHHKNIIPSQNRNIDKNLKDEMNNVSDLHNNQNTITSHESETYSTIISPMVGTFYRAPGPNEQPFIEQNDIVDKKQTVCIIEAMKLMNEIEAEVNGEIVEILVKDGDIVDCGQALMKVKTK